MSDPWTAARQASLPLTISQRLLKLVSIESVVSSNPLILCFPLLLLPAIFPSIKGINIHWIFIGSTDAEEGAPILWLSDVKSQPTVKDPDAGKDWRQKEKRAAEDEIIRWHHWLNGCEFEWTPGVGEYNGLKTISLTSGAGKSGQPLVKEWN